jgi:hypothetical protein
VRAALESNISDRCRVANKREFIVRVMVTISAEAGAAPKTATPAHKRKSLFVACQGPRSVSVFMIVFALSIDRRSRSEHPAVGYLLSTIARRLFAYDRTTLPSQAGIRQGNGRGLPTSRVRRCQPRRTRRSCLMRSKEASAYSRSTGYFCSVCSVNRPSSGSIRAPRPATGTGRAGTWHNQARGAKS